MARPANSAMIGSIRRASNTLRTSQDGSARFTISASGPGIAADQLPHIFDRFRRTDASRTRDTGGTGLGLAIYKAVVEAHGGKITVESEIAKGSTFSVLLPPMCH
jgi:signal transduction histidine kinase